MEWQIWNPEKQMQDISNMGYNKGNRQWSHNLKIVAHIVISSLWAIGSKNISVGDKGKQQAISLWKVAELCEHPPDHMTQLFSCQRREPCLPASVHWFSFIEDKIYWTTHSHLLIPWRSNSSSDKPSSLQNLKFSCCSIRIGFDKEIRTDASENKLMTWTIVCHAS